MTHATTSAPRPNSWPGGILSATNLPRAFRRRRRVGAYVRVSTQEQALGYGLGSQVAAIEKHITDNPEDFELVRFFADEGVSGTLKSRKGINDLEAAARRGEIDVIMVERTDRVGRSFSTCYHWVNALKNEMEIDFICTAQTVDTRTDTGMFLFIQFAQLSALEHKMILERTQGGKQLKAQGGGWPSGTPPYGLRIKGKGERGSVLEIHPDEQSVWELIATLVIDEKLSVPKAAERLNALGHTTRKGRTWTALAIYDLLRNDSLDGRVFFRKTHNKNTRTQTDREGVPKHGATVEIMVPRVLEPERVAALRASVKRAPKKQTGHVYPLSGHLKTPCGATYIGHLEVDSGRRAYRCSAYSNKGRRCNDPLIYADDVEPTVWHALTVLFSDKDSLRAMNERMLDELPDEQEKYLQRAETLRREVKDREERKKRAAYNIVAAELTPDEAASVMHQLRQELEATQNLLAETEAWLADYTEREAQVTGFIEMFETVEFNLANMDLSDQAIFIDRLGIECKFDAPFDPGVRTGQPTPLMRWHKNTETPIPPEVTDEQWESVHGLLRALPGFWGKNWRASMDKQLRNVLNGLLWRLRTGDQWSKLPPEYGHKGAVQRWAPRLWETGLWPVFMDILDARNTGAPLAFSFGIPPLRLSGRFSGELRAYAESPMSEAGAFNKVARSDMSVPFELAAA